MKTSLTKYVIITILVLTLFVPMHVLAGGGGGEGDPDLGEPQSPAASEPVGSTFSKPSGSSFGRPGTAGHVGGITMGKPTPAAITHGSYQPEIGSDGYWRPDPPPEKLREERQEQLIEEKRMADSNTAAWNIVTPITEGVGVATKWAVWALAYKTGVGWGYTLTMAGARAGAEGLGEHLAGKDGQTKERIAVGITQEALTSYLPPGVDIVTSRTLDKAFDKHLWGSQLENKAPKPREYHSIGWADKIIDQSRAKEEVKGIDSQLKDLQEFYEQNKNTSNSEQRAAMQKALSDLQKQKRAAEQRMY